jgi:hypothetical protein
MLQVPGGDLVSGDQSPQATLKTYPDLTFHQRVITLRTRRMPGLNSGAWSLVTGAEEWPLAICLASSAQPHGPGSGHKRVGPRAAPTAAVPAPDHTHPCLFPHPAQDSRPWLCPHTTVPLEYLMSQSGQALYSHLHQPCPTARVVNPAEPVMALHVPHSALDIPGAEVGYRPGWRS